MTSAITWGTSFDFKSNESLGDIVQSGIWSPGPGPEMSEPLFPHVTHGFRGINIPIVSYHVSFHLFLNVYQFSRFKTTFYFPIESALANNKIKIRKRDYVPRVDF